LGQRFGEVAERRAGAVAVVAGDTRLSYRELDRRSSAVAAALTSKGIGPGNLVAVCMPRCADLIVAILGIARAGAAYLPLEPTNPVMRRRRILALAEPVAIVSADPTHQADGDLVLLDELESPPKNARDAPRPPQTDFDSDALAYVIYTSGTTGEPKGVAVTNGNVSALVDAATAEIAATSEDIWTLFHSISFDFSVWELWGALLTGGTVVIADEETRRDPNLFANLIAREAVTVLSQTPSAFLSLTSAGTLEKSRLRVVVFGGEALTDRHLENWDDPACELVNMYGITEATVHTTAYHLRGRAAGRIPIGRALQGWTTYVVNDRGELARTNEVGELWIGGKGVAMGYYRRPDLTAERFTSARFGGTDERVYRTGDLVSVNTDGELTFHGRRDKQVKIRGHRVELDEIVNEVLAAAPMRDCVVVFSTTEDGFPEDRLDAFVVGSAVSCDELRQHLVDRLPSPLVPATISRVEAVPLTVNGKVDETALRSRLRQSPVQPDVSDRIDTDVASAWKATLGSPPRIGVGFFDAGGSSLLAVHLVRELQALGHELSVRDLYVNSTPDGLSTLLAR
jgi:amino acid adenylation domain-containing protein